MNNQSSLRNTLSNSADNNFPEVGVLAENIGLILQRGGEELVLLKMNDRLSVCPAIALTRPDPRKVPWVKQVAVTYCRTLTPANLDEYTVAPDLLASAMQIARASIDVNAVSHVYQIKNNPGTLIYLSNQITVQFGQELDSAAIDAIATETQIIKVKPIPNIPNTFVFTLSSQSRENPVKITNRLIKLPEVLTAEPNIVIDTQSYYCPRAPLYPKQWYLYNNGGNDLADGSHIAAESAWDITRGVRSIVIAIADHSVDLKHPDFQGLGKIVAPLNLTAPDFLSIPPNSEDHHGTSCAGVAIAEENGMGVVGVAPGCALMPIQTTGFLDDESIEQIFNWAIEQGASVISCSWGPSAIYFPLSLRQSAAITRAATAGRNGKGCVIVFAAGNANRPINDIVNEQGWPKDGISGPTKWLGGFTTHPDVITVSASTSQNKKAAYSNWGNGISVCAPSNNAPPGIWLQQTGYVMTAPELQTPINGEGVFTTDRLGAAGYNPSDFTSDFGGTSSATPIVAGVAGLILSVNPDLTAAEVKQILQQSADKIIDNNIDPQLGFQMGNYNANGYSQWFGYGKVNAFKALQLAQRRLPTPVAITRQIQGKNNQAQAIPDCEPQTTRDRPGLISSINLNDAGLVRDIQVTVKIEHSFLGDLEINLIAPDQQIVLLQSRTLGRTTQLEATYSLQTNPALRQFLNLPVQGTWQLWIIDQAVGDTGILKNWQLTLGI